MLKTINFFSSIFVLVVGIFFSSDAHAACTSFLISKGASADGSTMITYAADSHEFYGQLEYRPGGVYSDGTMIDVYEWDSGKLLGQIKQAPKTYTAVGNMNEHQVVISETTFGGREELANPQGGIDYGSLIFTALQRAKTAREAINIIVGLVNDYGYASTGESLSIGDPREVWIMEIIGRGPKTKGALWVARRLPDGYISAHANQSRIRQFPLRDPQNTLYASDVISFAREKKYFSGPDANFSFADAFAPLDFAALRACEARVWSMFRRAAPSQKIPIDYVLGKDGAAPLPLWIKPDKKLAVRDVMDLMRDHFENSEMDLSQGVGAGPFNLPYRWRPMVWKVDGVSYFHERATSTQQTGFSFVSQSRSWLPNPLGGILWFGLDDTASTVYMPVYSGITKVPRSLQAHTATLHRFSWDSAFWVFNWVANWAYSRYSDMIQDIRKLQLALEGNFLGRQAEIEAAALKLYQSSPAQARDFLTKYTNDQVEETVARWRKFGEELLVTYMDGNVKDEMGKVQHPPYPDQWYRRIVKESGEKYKMRKLQGQKEPPPTGLSRYVFENKEDLGPLAPLVPADFSFNKEKLVLLPGTAQCGQMPRCCLKLVENKSLKKNEVQISAPPTAPKAKDPDLAQKCGQAGWLIRVPKNEKRDLVPPEGFTVPK